MVMTNLMEQHLRSHNLGWIKVLIRLTPAAHLQRARELARPTTAFQQLCRLASCCSAGGYVCYPAQIVLHVGVAQSIQVYFIHIHIVVSFGVWGDFAYVRRGGPMGPTGP